MSSNSVNSEVYVKLEETYSYKQYIEIYTNQDKTIQFLNFLNFTYLFILRKLFLFDQIHDFL